MNEKAKSKNNGIAAWPEDERTRERLLARGADALTDAELLAILLRVGVQGKSAVEMGCELLLRFGSLQGLMSASLTAWAGTSEENSKKFKYAKDHFVQLNHHLQQEELSTRYRFNFLTPANFNTFFQALRDRQLETFTSQLDVILNQEERVE